MKNPNEKKTKCGAPIGNKNAVGHGCGRPPTYDYEEEARKLLEWSLRDDALRLYGFTDDKDYCTSDLSFFAEKSIIFSKALSKAKERLAIRRESYCNQELICSTVYNKTSHIYDHELEHNDESRKEKELSRQIRLKEIEAKLKAQEAKDVSEQTQNSFNALMNQLDMLQSQRKSADSNTSNA